MENLEIYKRREYITMIPPRQPSLRFNNDQFMTNLFHCCHCSSVTESSLTLCDPMDCSWSGSSVHGILQARILDWVAMPFFRYGHRYGHSYGTRISYLPDTGMEPASLTYPALAGGFFTTSTTEEGEQVNYS